MPIVQTSTLKSHVDGRSKVAELIRESESIADAERRELACLRDGCSNFASEFEIREAANVDRRDVAKKADALVADAKQRAAAYLADSFQLRPRVASELAPLLDANLSDADLRQLARQHRDYTSLRMIAGCDGKFSEELRRRLDSYRAGVDAEIDRALRLAKSAIVRTPAPGSIFNSRNCWGDGAPIDAALENVDRLNSDFDAWLDAPDAADAPRDGLLRAVLENA